jgi:hypothetical protein
LALFGKNLSQKNGEKPLTDENLEQLKADLKN